MEHLRVHKLQKCREGETTKFYKFKFKFQKNVTESLRVEIPKFNIDS
jgi:hypothetical protein